MQTDRGSTVRAGGRALHMLQASWRSFWISLAYVTPTASRSRSLFMPFQGYDGYGILANRPRNVTYLLCSLFPSSPHLGASGASSFGESQESTGGAGDGADRCDKRTKRDAAATEEVCPEVWPCSKTYEPFPRDLTQRVADAFFWGSGGPGGWTGDDDGGGTGVDDCQTAEGWKILGHPTV